MGVPIAILTNSAFFLNLNKTLFNEQLQLSFTTMIDASFVKKDGLNPNESDREHSSDGVLMELKATYSFYQDLNGSIAITKINGDPNHPEGLNYAFNQLEDFSHLRFELKYFF